MAAFGGENEIGTAIGNPIRSATGAELGAGAAPGTGFVRGALEALAIPALFVAAGLLWVGAMGLTAADPSPYPVPTMSPADGTPQSSSPQIWLVDGFNVVQVGLLGGRDREGWWLAQRREELLARAAGFDDEAAEVWVVFDGPDARTARPLGEAGPHEVFTPSADEWLVREVAQAQEPSRVVVVTADRRVAARVRRRGSLVVGPIDFLRRCREAI